MHNVSRRLGGWLAHYLTAPSRGPYPYPAADLDLLRTSLKPADVVLVEGRQRISSAIKYLTQSTWSHAALFVGAAGGRGAQDQSCTLVEADVERGIRTFPLEELAGYHLRICRPIGLSEHDARQVVAYALQRVGDRYDLKNVFDLFRYLLRIPPVPAPWRRRMLALGSGDPTRAICSTLIAQAFQVVGFPILPIIRLEAAARPDCHDCMREMYHIRHHSLFVPRDFDVSPYFEVIKPGLRYVSDYHALPWANGDVDAIWPPPHPRRHDPRA
ncbi:MAG: lipo-like protein [Xanthomonadaceae bacterium]|nr:lipo-like protein [Xanthomonadaceae bacterium]MDE2278151.1 lipo-like protein [Xanthomonadaceae bacterium]MDE2316527.1 lipo-like protein [Xanthomonadaceae bacterium]